ncbi:MAG: hypothetical protein AAF458_09400 [Pseudomonadota bacterium]
MSAIAWYLERAGIATTGISLVRENTESFGPPRFLWVSFPLGRPLGTPGDAGFQHRVIASALSLLERRDGPVLEDFPEDAAGPAPDAGELVCPVSFAPQARDDAGGWAERLAGEARSLAPWYDAARETRAGRTSVGILVDSPVDLAREAGAALDSGNGLPRARCKHVLEDLKAYYLEAMLAQPGADAETLGRWLWLETVLGDAMLELRKTMLVGAEGQTALFAESLVPRWVLDLRAGDESSEDRSN